MSYNLLLYFLWCIFFALVAGQFVTGVPFFILVFINAIAAQHMLLPRRSNGRK